MSVQSDTDFRSDNEPADGSRPAEGWSPYEVWRTRVLQPSLEAAAAQAPVVAQVPRSRKRLKLFRKLWRPT